MIRTRVIFIKAGHYDKSLEHYTGHWLCIARGARYHPSASQTHPHSCQIGELHTATAQQQQSHNTVM